jgi:hypothetical protein
MNFLLLPHLYAVARLEPAAALPGWIPSTGLCSVTRTDDELSIVCLERAVPHELRAERGWRALKLLGPIPFEMTGVAASFTAPLARAAISVFVISTYDTDYLLVKSEALQRSAEALREAGFEVDAAETEPGIATSS